MVNSRRQVSFFAVLLYLCPAEIQDRSDDGKSVLILSFVSNACQTIYSAASHQAEKYCLALVVGIMRKGDDDFFFRNRLWAGLTVTCRLAAPLYLQRFLRKSVISGFAACFLRSHSKFRRQRLAVSDCYSARNFTRRAKFLHISLVFFGRALPQLVIDMHGVKLPVELWIFFRYPEKHIKKAHRIRTSGETDYDVRITFYESVFFNDLQRFVFHVFSPFPDAFIRACYLFRALLSVLNNRYPFCSFKIISIG